MQFQKVLLVAAVIIGFLAFLWMVISTLLSEHIPNTIQPEDGYIFDYVVVGAGTAGSVVASLLSKHSNASILLIEAGDKFGLLSKIPLFTTFQQKGLNDWAFLTVPQRHSSKSLEEQRQCLPRGKGLGGSAQLNYMLHYDGQPLDFDNWAHNYNLNEWRYEAVRPFLEAGHAKSHETLAIPHDYSKVTAALHQAAAEFQHKPWHIRLARYNIKNGLRHSVWQRFLQPALKQRSLRVMTNAFAKQIILKQSSSGLRADSLIISFKDAHTRKERRITVAVRCELIVSAGAYQTPQLLLASGIGNKHLLDTLNINTQLNLPRVGSNLHDHLNVPLFVSINVIGPTLNQRALLNPLSMFEYLTSGTGQFGNFGVLGHVNVDREFMLTIFGVGAVEESALMSISNFKRADFRALFPRYYNNTQEGFVLISSCLQPKSRGTVSISSPNTRQKPLIDPNYLSESADVACTIKALRAAVEIVASQAFAELQPRIHWPKLKGCATFGPFESDFQNNKPTDRYLECVVRHVGLGSHHPGGTCSMGANASTSVVDAYFRLHGVPNLRIIDASVLPTPISGNPNSIIVSMAIRGATMLLKDVQRNNELKETKK